MDNSAFPEHLLVALVDVCETFTFHIMHLSLYGVTKGLSAIRRLLWCELRWFLEVSILGMEEMLECR